MKKNVIYLILILTTTTLSIGCSATLPPLTNTIPLGSSDLAITVPDRNQTKLVIFNTSSSSLFPYTGRISVYLNGRGVARLYIGQYVQLIVPQGKYRVDLLHKDIFDFPSSHTIELAATEAYLEIYATILSNEARLMPKLADDFARKFVPVH